jgi:AraC-like DNA-binding protein
LARGGIVDLRQTLDRIVIDPKQDPARGLLNKERSLAAFELVRLAPSPDLAEFIEHFWMILWDLRDAAPYTQENLPHPTQHLVIDPVGGTGIFGLMRSKFTYTLEGSGRVIGTKFRPAAFRRFYGRPVSEITDRVIAVSGVLNAKDAELDKAFLGLNEPASMADRIEDLLRAHLPGPDERALEAERIVALIDAEPDIVSVAGLSRRTRISARTLQRLFMNYVGVGPKWVIDRYRMIEAVEALNAQADVSLTSLAHALGYFDQAHFSKAFVALTGKSPSSYKRAG